jgi:ribosome biogenesis GTPase
MELQRMGWSPTLDYYVEQLLGELGLEGVDDCRPARVTRAIRGHAWLLTDQGPEQALWRGPLPVADGEEVEQLVVGDWCLVQDDPEGTAAVIGLLPRRTCFHRGRASGRRTAQAIAANIDVIFVVCGLDGDFSTRRIERYLTLVRASGARAVIVLNKLDLCSDLAEVERELRDTSRGLHVVAVSATQGRGLDELGAELGPGMTGAFLGSSGAGKSTLINALLGEERQPTREVREHDQRGRHTTSASELFVLPEGGLVIDTPGLREVGMLGDLAAVDETFGDIAELATGCGFRDCRHEGEPECAVLQAVEAGELAEERLESYQQLVREAEAAERRQSAFAERSHERQTWGNVRRLGRQQRRLDGKD